jgi:hypothetical protein
LLSAQRDALLVTEDGKPVSAAITRHDLLTFLRLTFARDKSLQQKKPLQQKKDHQTDFSNLRHPLGPGLT